MMILANGCTFDDVSLKSDCNSEMTNAHHCLSNIRLQGTGYNLSLNQTRVI